MGAGRFCLLTIIIVVAALQASAQKKEWHLLEIKPIEQDALSASGGKQATDTGFLVVRNILVSGNRKTRTAIILRDLRIQPRDTLRLDSLDALLEEKRQYLLNTSLFLTVRVFLSGIDGGETDVNVEVTERWYTFAFPVFSLADRNFNVWWVDEHHRLDRINYGLNLYQYNLTGRQDRLTLSLQNGYTHRYALTYQLPYFDKELKHGLGFSVSYSQNREVNFRTVLNKQDYFKQDQFLKKQFNAGVFYTYKKAIRLSHKISLNYHFLAVDDTILGLNPRYFPDDNTQQRYLELSYLFSYNGADRWAYPLQGFTIRAQIVHRGFGMLGATHETELQLNTSRYWKFYPKTYAAVNLRGKILTSGRPAYFLLKGMGYYEDYLRGLEYYVVDADRYGIVKTALKRELLSFRASSSLLPKKFSVIPIRIYVKVFADLGYAHNERPGNSVLNNKMLYTYGAGIDIVTFYDIRLRMEYSFNQLGEKGLFLHTKAEF